MSKVAPARRKPADKAGAPAKDGVAAAVAAMPFKKPARVNPWSLRSFFDEDPAKNLALQHPFVLANAAEKAYALISHVGPRRSKDPLYNVHEVTIYPMLAGEHPASFPRKVVGQEVPVNTFVQFLASAARGDRTGKAVGFPGPAGTGKTELFYTIDQLSKRLGKEDKYKQFSYRFVNLHTIPKLAPLFKMIPGPDGVPVPMNAFFNPDLARSPFTLLRGDMQDRLLKDLRPKIRSKWNVMISKGWKDPEPKTREIIRRIFEHEYPDFEQGLMSIDDLTEEEYLAVLDKYVSIVPKEVVRPATLEARVIGAKKDNPNMAALLTTPNMMRVPLYTLESELAINYTGTIFQQDGGLLMFDELYRNDPALLTLLLDTIQNHVVEGEVGRPVKLDVLTVWNSNDESIAAAMEVGETAALNDRTDSPPMRLLVPPKQIEAVIPFQVGDDMFRMRPLGDISGKDEILPFVHSEVYPAVDPFGETKTAQGRYALYYHIDGTDYLIAPYTLNFISWIAAATRVEADEAKISVFTELDLVGGNHNVLYNAVNRVRAMIGDMALEPVHRKMLYRLHNKAKDGMKGISSRDIETWTKEMITLAQQTGQNVITPRMANQALVDLLESGRIKTKSHDLQLHWNLLRERIAQDMLLPKMWNDVRTIVSAEGNKAERIYDTMVEEFLIEAASEPGQNLAELGIHEGRRNKVKEIYRKKTGRDFNISLITRILHEANPTGGTRRHPELLDCVREMLAENESFTSDHIASLDRSFRGADEDPIMRQKLSDIINKLSAYGYDKASFQDAVKLVAQLDADKKRRLNQGPRQ